MSWVKPFTVIQTFAIAISMLSCHPKSPQTDIDLLELTVSLIHEAYQNGDYTAEQLVSAYLQRIEELDMSLGLNAIVLINPDAIKKARALDKEYQQTGKLRQLHGIPMIVKDNYNTKGLQTTAGSMSLR